MKKIFPAIGLISIAMINSGCPKPCVEANLSFKVHAWMVPDKDSIQIGDTLYLESVFQTNLMDERTSQVIDYSNSEGIGSTLTVSSLPLNDTIARDAAFDFDYVSIKGKIYNDRSIPRPDGVQQLTYGEIIGKYGLKIGLIPQKKGRYILAIGKGLSNGRKKGKNCEKAAFNISITSTNQHFYLMNEWKTNYILNKFGREHGYAFKVY